MAERPESIMNLIPDGVVRMIDLARTSSPNAWKTIPRVVKRGVASSDFVSGPMPAVMVTSNGSIERPQSRPIGHERFTAVMTVVCVAKPANSNVERQLMDLLDDVWKVIADNRQIREIFGASGIVLPHGMLSIGEATIDIDDEPPYIGIAFFDLRATFEWKPTPLGS